MAMTQFLAAKSEVFLQDENLLEAEGNPLKA